MTNGFDEILLTASPRVRDLATRTRARIRAVMPAVVEVPWPRHRTIGYGVGPRKKSEHFCYIAVHNDHVRTSASTTAPKTCSKAPAGSSGTRRSPPRTSRTPRCAASSRSPPPTVCRRKRRPRRRTVAAGAGARGGVL